MICLFPNILVRDALAIISFFSKILITSEDVELTLMELVSSSIKSFTSLSGGLVNILERESIPLNLLVLLTTKRLSVASGKIFFILF